MATFKQQIRGITKKYHGDMNKVVQHIAVTLFSMVIYKSPVLTGRFRGNWQCSIGGPTTGELDTLDKSDAATIAKVRAVTDTMKVGNTIWLTNNLPYALALEYGHSAQAPQGMVRISLMQIKSKLGKLGV